MDKNIKKIGVLTSGGDSPGMNACIRAVVRCGIYHNLEVVGICQGFQGMIDGEFIHLDSRSVSNIIQRGGTILKSARSQEFRSVEGRETAHKNLVEQGIDGLVCIGGDGTFKGAHIFYKEFGLPSVGIPGTIDNDLFGTDYTIGYDTAINTAMEAVDRIRDTAAAHNRLFFVEVMGKDAGFIALRTGIAGGAESILIPETVTIIDDLVAQLKEFNEKKKTSIIVIVAEGDDAGGAFEIAAKVKKQFDFYDTRVSVIGHMQRGGSPTCMDRVLGSRLGVAAVECLLEGKVDIMVGLSHKEISETPLSNAVKHHQYLNHDLLKIADILSLY